MTIISFHLLIVYWAMVNFTVSAMIFHFIVAFLILFHYIKILSYFPFISIFLSIFISIFLSIFLFIFISIFILILIVILIVILIPFQFLCFTDPHFLWVSHLLFLLMSNCLTVSIIE